MFETARASIAVDGYTILPKAVPNQLCNDAVRAVEREAGRLAEPSPAGPAGLPDVPIAIAFANLMTSPSVTRYRACSLVNSRRH